MDNKTVVNNDDVWAAFGFRKSPYDTHALSSEEGDKLLVGREEEVKWLTMQLTNTTRIPVLIGDNGVGKTSIANVVAYRLGSKNKEGDQHFFVLELNQVCIKQSDNLKLFEQIEQNLFYNVVRILLNERSFLKQRGISTIEIVHVFFRMIITGIGFGPVTLEIKRNAEFFNRVARKWLKKCFDTPAQGGIICTIDNLENIGTSNAVQATLERYRDVFFNIPGLRWILCGTSFAANGALVSPILSGYLQEKTIEPIDERFAPQLVQRRIEYFAKDNGTPQPPVDKNLFQFVYEVVVNQQLRIALQLCEEFALYLHGNSQRQAKDRMSELKLWLNQKSGTLQNQMYKIPEKSWTVLSNIADLGGEISSRDYQLVNLTNLTELDRHSQPLIQSGFLIQTQIDDGYLLRVTEPGLLANYRKKTKSEGAP